MNFSNFTVLCEVVILYRVRCRKHNKVSKHTTIKRDSAWNRILKSDSCLVLLDDEVIPPDNKTIQVDNKMEKDLDLLQSKAMCSTMQS